MISRQCGSVEVAEQTESGNSFEICRYTGFQLWKKPQGDPGVFGLSIGKMALEVIEMAKAARGTEVPFLFWSR